MDKLSYALGLSMGNNFMRSGIESINYGDFAAGVEAAYKGDLSQMSLDEAKQTVNRFFAEMENRLQEVNKKAGEQYLAENAKTGASFRGRRFYALFRFCGRKNRRADHFKSSSHAEGHASDGIFQSPLGDNATEPTLGASGVQLRLNCCEKKRR